MPVRVAINGFGRIGRLALRSAVENDAPVEFVGINDVAGIETLAHLLRHATVYAPFPGTVETRGDVLVVKGRQIPVQAIPDPAAPPWMAADADVVLECTGKSRERAD